MIVVEVACVVDEVARAVVVGRGCVVAAAMVVDVVGEDLVAGMGVDSACLLDDGWPALAMTAIRTANITGAAIFAHNGHDRSHTNEPRGVIVTMASRSILTGTLIRCALGRLLLRCGGAVEAADERECRWHIEEEHG